MLNKLSGKNRKKLNKSKKASLAKISPRKTIISSLNKSHTKELPVFRLTIIKLKPHTKNINSTIIDVFIHYAIYG